MHHCYVGTSFRAMDEEDESADDELLGHHGEKLLLPAPPLSKLRVAELDELIELYRYARETATWNQRGLPDRAMSIYVSDLNDKIKELQDMRLSKSRKKSQ